MKKPLVSIITPCFNMAHGVWRLFDSIIAQNYRPIEFILVDDGSTDGIKDLVEQYRMRFKNSGIKFIFFQQENKGVSSAINLGLKNIQGEYFCCPDADDYFEPTSISERVVFLEKNKQYGTVVSNAYVLQSDNMVNRELMIREQDYEYHRNENQFENLLRGESIFCPGCHLTRTACFIDVNPDMKIYPARRGQNWQLLLPIYYKYKRGFIEKPLFNIVSYPNSLSKSDTSIDRLIAKLYEYRIIIIETLSSIENSQNVSLKKYKKTVKRQYDITIIKIKLKKLLGEIIG